MHVVYGIVGLKTHCKLSLVVRREGNHLRRYAHIGTGNYHPSTARFYEDLGIITCDEQICETSRACSTSSPATPPKTSYKSSLVAPRSLRSGLIERIDREIENHQAGKRQDSDQVQLNGGRSRHRLALPRFPGGRAGGCGRTRYLRPAPGVPGLSENIRVRSILGRFLEHSRVRLRECGRSGRVHRLG